MAVGTDPARFPACRRQDLDDTRSRRDGRPDDLRCRGVAEAGADGLSRGCAGGAWCVALGTVNRLATLAALYRVRPRKDAMTGSCEQLGIELALAELTAGKRGPVG